MIPSLPSGISSIQFRDLDTPAGSKVITCMFMEVLNMIFQIFLSVKFVKLILKDYLLSMITYCRK